MVLAVVEEQAVFALMSLTHEYLKATAPVQTSMFGKISCYLSCSVVGSQDAGIAKIRLDCYLEWR